MATAEKHLQVVQGNALNQFAPDKVELIKNTVAKGTTNDELEMFLYLAGQYGLDPFKKEIWCIKYDKNSAATIMTSRDGYLKIAQSNPDFDGVKSFVVHEGDTFEIDAMTDQITHKFGTKRGKIIGAWAIAYHKKLRPQICFVNFDEYNAGTSIWKKYPSAMIQKVAESFVLKRQFGINGLVTQEEVSEQQYIETDMKPVEEPKPVVDARAEFKRKWMEKATELGDVAHARGIDKEGLRELGIAVLDEGDPTKWTMDDMDKLIGYLQEDVVTPMPESETQNDEGGELPGQTDLNLDDLNF